MAKQLFTYLFDKWWRPILISAFSAIILIAFEYFDPPIPYVYVSPLILFIPFLFLISGVYQLVKRRWWQASITIIPLIVAIISVIIFAVNFEAHTIIK